MEAVTDFIFLGSQITADGDGRHEIRRRLFLGRSAMTNLDSILKSTDITLLTKVHLVKAVFPVVMYECESWTIKKAKHQRIDAFELWCWRRLLRVPWTTRRSNQSIITEISPEYLLEGLMMKLKLQYFGHLMQRTDSLEKTLMLGMIEGRRRRGRQRMRWLGVITDSMDMSLSKFWESVMEQWGLACCSPWGHKELDTTEWLNWTELINLVAAAKSLQSCPTLCDPIDGSPPGSPVPGILQAKTLEWVAISFSNAWKWKVKVKSLSRVQPLATPWTAAYQASPSMGSSRQEHQSGLPVPSPNKPC